MGCHPSHWQTHIFQDGYRTSNQNSIIILRSIFFVAMPIYIHHCSIADMGISLCGFVWCHQLTINNFFVSSQLAWYPCCWVWEFTGIRCDTQNDRFTPSVFQWLFNTIPIQWEDHGLFSPQNPSFCWLQTAWPGSLGPWTTISRTVSSTSEPFTPIESPSFEASLVGWTYDDSNAGKTMP